MFLYATQSPLFAQSSRLQVQDQYLPMVDATMATWAFVGTTWYRHKVIVDYVQATPWNALPPCPMAAYRCCAG
ncbi:MAG: hypothetical protein ACKPKO_61100, partial [Candidatus Fonsibacter sp.]